MPLIPLAVIFASGVSRFFEDRKTAAAADRLKLALGIEHGVSKIDPPRTKRSPDEDCGPGRDQLCAYHATQYTRLPSIALYGLSPLEPDLGLEQPPGVYFAPIPAFALSWNDVLLRFPWPDDVRDDPRGEGVSLGKRREVDSRTGFYSEQPILPEHIEVWTKDGWVPLINPEFELVVCLDSWMAEEAIEDHHGDPDPFGIGPGCTTYGALCWAGYEILPLLDVDVFNRSFADMFRQLEEKDIGVELRGPWRTENETFIAPPGTLWRMIRIDLEPNEKATEEAPETIVFEPRKMGSGVLGEDKTIPRICCGPSPELAIYALDPDGGSLISGGAITELTQRFQQMYADWSPSIWAMYTNTDSVSAVIPADTLLPDGRITGEIWVLQPSEFRVSFVLTGREAVRIGDAMRNIKGMNDEAHRESVLAIHRLLHEIGAVSGERMG